MRRPFPEERRIGGGSAYIPKIYIPSGGSGCYHVVTFRMKLADIGAHFRLGNQIMLKVEAVAVLTRASAGDDIRRQSGTETRSAAKPKLGTEKISNMLDFRKFVKNRRTENIGLQTL